MALQDTAIFWQIMSRRFRQSVASSVGMQHSANMAFRQGIAVHGVPTVSGRFRRFWQVMAFQNMHGSSSRQQSSRQGSM